MKYRAEKLSQARLLTNRIRLRLNPEEERSKALLDLITQLFEVSSLMELEGPLGRAVSKSQEILKAMEPS